MKSFCQSNLGYKADAYDEEIIFRLFLLVNLKVSVLNAIFIHQW